jgi:hypothetical protein
MIDAIEAEEASELVSGEAKRRTFRYVAMNGLAGKEWRGVGKHSL